MRFNELNEMLTGRCAQSKSLENNTKAIRIDADTCAIRLHSTNILTFTRKPERVVVDTGGWQTVTTKDRIKKYLPGPWQIYQQNRQWFWCGRSHNNIPVPFTDWDYILHDPKCLDGEGWPQWRLKAQSMTKKGMARTEAQAKLIKRIDAYAKLCASKLPLPMPGGGDCWYCVMYDEKNGKT